MAPSSSAHIKTGKDNEYYSPYEKLFLNDPYSYNMFPFLPAPGADDDGSGSVTILESYRALIKSDFKPVHNVEFHWYSAEVCMGFLLSDVEGC
jgi:hypothetical protein